MSTVYMVLYNYEDANYSVVKILTSFEKAVNYIYDQEINEFTEPQELTLVEINKYSDIANKCVEHGTTFYVCIMNENDIYLYKNFLETEHISSYIIVKTKLE